jgi:hypothetical protein
MSMMDRMNTFIRAVREEDVPALIELANQLGYPTQPGEIAERLAHLKTQKNHQVFVAEERGSGVVGWVHVIGAYHLIIEPSAELGGVVVQDGWRQRNRPNAA